MALLLTNYTSALKEILLPYIRNNFPKQTILLDQMKRNAGVNRINDEFVAPIYSGRHGGVATVANALTAQTQTLAEDYARQVNRQLYSDGVGVVSEVLGSVSGTEFSVTRPTASLDDGRSIDWYGSVNGDIDPLKYIAV